MKFPPLLLICFAIFTACNPCGGAPFYSSYVNDCGYKGQFILYKDSLTYQLNMPTDFYGIHAPIQFYTNNGQRAYRTVADSLTIIFADGKRKTDYNCSNFRAERRNNCLQDTVSLFNPKQYLSNEEYYNTQMCAAPNRHKTDTSCYEYTMVYAITKKDYDEAR